MFRIVLTAAALAATGPALAANQLETALGVDRGVYSNAQLAKLFLRDEDAPRVHFKSQGKLVISTHDFSEDGARRFGENASSRQSAYRQ